MYCSIQYPVPSPVPSAQYLLYNHRFPSSGWLPACATASLPAPVTQNRLTRCHLVYCTVQYGLRSPTDCPHTVLTRYCRPAAWVQPGCRTVRRWLLGGGGGGGGGGAATVFLPASTLPSPLRPAPFLTFVPSHLLLPFSPFSFQPVIIIIINELAFSLSQIGRAHV